MSLPRNGRRQSLLSPYGLLAFLVTASIATGPSVPSAHATAWIKTNPQVRIRIVEASSRTQLRGFDLKFFSYARHSETLGAPSQSRRPAAQADRVSSWKLDCPNGAVVRATMIAPEPLSTRPLMLAAPLLVESPSGFVSVEGRPYREKILIHPVKKSGKWTCEFVNHVDIEKYLDGLVNAEFNAKWSREAIDAQVIAARTYAYYQMKLARDRKDDAHFDLDSTIRDQVYDGSMREDYRASLAAERTRGVVLKASLRDDWPIKAYYHSTCGGTTELPESVWGKKERGFARRSNCPFCHESPSYLWDIPLASKEVAHQIWVGARNMTAPEKLTKAWPEGWRNWLRDASLTSMKVVLASPAGRVGKVVTDWQHGEKKFSLEIPATQFRFWVGTTKLKSTVFQILPAKSGAFVLRGRGYGHGVGLCQWGAKVAGERGKTHAQILKLYYPDAVMAKAW